MNTRQTEAEKAREALIKRAQSMTLTQFSQSLSRTEYADISRFGSFTRDFWDMALDLVAPESETK